MSQNLFYPRDSRIPPDRSFPKPVVGRWSVNFPVPRRTEPTNTTDVIVIEIVGAMAAGLLRDVFEVANA